MSDQEDFDEVLKGVDAALRRAALKAKEEAERNGTPYVVAEANNNIRRTVNESALHELTRGLPTGVCGTE